MRSISHEPPREVLDELPSMRWWDTLTLAEQIEWQLGEVLCFLCDVGARLRTKEGRPLRWMEKSVDCAFRDVDRILERLETGDEG